MARPSPIAINHPIASRIPDPAREAQKTLTRFFGALLEKAQGLYPEGSLPRKKAIIVHSALSAFGYVPGGAETVARALCESARMRGVTLVMCAHTDDEANAYGDTQPDGDSIDADGDALPDRDCLDAGAKSENTPRFDDGELPAIVAFDRKRSPCLGMGAIAERFRTLAGTKRSGHPTLSFTARGPLARKILFPHRRESGVGPDSPAGRLRDLDALVLLIGVGYERCTILHLAEYARAERIAESGAVPDTVTCQAFERTALGGWKSRTWTDIAFDPAAFPKIGERFEREMPGSVIVETVPRVEAMSAEDARRAAGERVSALARESARAPIRVFRARALTEFCIDRCPDLR